MCRTFILMVSTDTQSSLSCTLHFSGGINRIASVSIDKRILNTSMSDFLPEPERQSISKASSKEARWICQGEVMYEMSLPSPMVNFMGFVRFAILHNSPWVLFVVVKLPCFIFKSHHYYFKVVCLLTKHWHFRLVLISVSILYEQLSSLFNFFIFVAVHNISKKDGRSLISWHRSIHALKF